MIWLAAFLTIVLIVIAPVVAWMVYGAVAVVGAGVFVARKVRQ